MRQTAGYGQTTVRPPQASWVSGRGSGGGSVGGGGGGTEVSRPSVVGGGSPATAMEQGSVSVGARRSVRVPTESRRDARSSRRIAVGAGDGTGGATNADEESFNRHFALETPLQQVRETRAKRSERSRERGIYREREVMAMAFDNP